MGLKVRTRQTSAEKPQSKVTANAAKVAARGSGVEPYRHQLDIHYEGKSQPLTRSGGSRTRIPVEEFNTQPKIVLTERMNVVLRGLRETYGGDAEFERGNLDAGVLKTLVRKGVVRHVNGDPAALDSTFALVE